MKAKSLFSLTLALTTAACCAQTQTNFTHVNPVGFRMISNPLLSTNNDVSNLYQNPPVGLTLFKRNAMGTGYDSATFDSDVPGWTAPMTLVPGEGAFLYNPGPANYSNTFFGELLSCATNSIAEGFSIRSPKLLRADELKNFVESQIAIPKPITFFFYTGSNYDSCAYDPDIANWTCPGGPLVRPGESCWIANSSGNGTKQWIYCPTNSP